MILVDCRWRSADKRWEPTEPWYLQHNTKWCDVHCDAYHCCADQSFNALYACKWSGKQICGNISNSLGITNNIDQCEYTQLHSTHKACAVHATTIQLAKRITTAITKQSTFLRKMTSRPPCWKCYETLPSCLCLCHVCNSCETTFDPLCLSIVFCSLEMPPGLYWLVCSVFP